MAFKAKELADMLGGTLEGDPDIVISGLAKIEEAQSGDVTFMANPKYERFLKTTKASLVLVSDSQATPAGNYIRVPDPYTCFARLLTVFHPPETPPAKGIHLYAMRMPSFYPFLPNLFVHDEIGPTLSIFLFISFYQGLENSPVRKHIDHPPVHLGIAIYKIFEILLRLYGGSRLFYDLVLFHVSSLK